MAWPALDSFVTGLDIADVNFLNDTGDDIIFGHNNAAFNDAISDNLTTTPHAKVRWARLWEIDRNDEGANGGQVDLTFDISDAGGTGNFDLSKTYYLLSRPTGSSVDFTEVSVISSTVLGDQVTFRVASANLDSEFTIGTTNLAPVANAGANQQVPVNDVVTLDGSGSFDPDGHIPLSYGWQQTGGGGVILNSPTISRPTFTAPSVPNVLTFTLVVTDATGLASLPASVMVTVHDTAITNVGAANDSPTTLGHTTHFTATASGSNLAYSWAFGDGSPLGSGSTVTHVYALTGSYVATVTASNSISTVVATTQVTITNLAPVANAGANQQVQVNAVVTLDGSGSFDPDGHIPLSYGWQQTGGVGVILNSPTISRPTFTAPSVPNVLTFTLVVTDAAGLASAPASVVITVKDTTINNVGAANDSPTTLGHTTHFTATASGSNLAYSWAFGDGSPLGSGSTVTHVYALTGSYVATVTASNSISTVVATTLVTITNLAPVANAGANQQVRVNDVVTLDGSGSFDPDGHIPLSYGWQQTGGVGVILNSPTISRPTFTAPSVPNVLTFTLVVTDAAGLASAPASVVITVKDTTINNVGAANDSPTTLGHTTHFTATASGSNLAYSWAFGDGSPLGSGSTVTHVYALTGSYVATVTASNSISTVVATTLVTITNLAPVANAGANQQVRVNDVVTLDGSGSFDPDGQNPLSYGWQQTGGMGVILSSATISRPTFTAPAASAVLTFTLVVTDAYNLVGVPSSVTITVVPYSVYIPIILKSL